MKKMIALALLVMVGTANAAVYNGKKFKMTITKQPDGQRVVEGEVWDTTRSEHTLVIKTVPAATTEQPIVTTPVVDPRWDLTKGVK